MILTRTTKPACHLWWLESLFWKLTVKEKESVIFLFLCRVYIMMKVSLYRNIPVKKWKLLIGLEYHHFVTSNKICGSGLWLLQAAHFSKGQIKRHYVFFDGRPLHHP